MDLLLIKLERVDNDFYESLIKFISDRGYQPKVIVHNIDSLSISGLEIVSSKRQLFRHKIITYINKIRKKIEPDPANPIYILTVWGIGYKFNEKIE